MVRIHLWLGDWLETAIVGLAHSMFWLYFDLLFSKLGRACFVMRLLEVIISFGGAKIIADDIVIGWLREGTHAI